MTEETSQEQDEEKRVDESPEGEDTSDDGAGGDGTAGKAEEDRGPWAAFAEIQGVVTDLVDSAIRGVQPLTPGRFPRYDLIDQGQAGLEVWIDLPDMAKSDITLKAVVGELTVSGSRARPELPVGAEVLRSDRHYGDFERVIKLPDDVDVSGIRARLENGVLRIELPRRHSEDAREVEIG